VSVAVQVAVGIVATALYPALLILTGIVSRSHVRPLASALIAVAPIRRRAPASFRRRLLLLEPHDLTVLDALVRRREDITEFAKRRGESEGAVRLHLVVALRRLSDLPAGHALHSAISRYVLEDENVVHHISLSKRLIEQGCDPRTTDAVYEAARAVRAMSARSWPATTIESAPRPPLRRLGSLFP